MRKEAMTVLAALTALLSSACVSYTPSGEPPRPVPTSQVFAIPADALWDRVMDMLTEHYTISQLAPSERFAQVSVAASLVDVDCGHLKAKNLATDYDGNAAGLFEWEVALSIRVTEGETDGTAQLRLNTQFRGQRLNGGGGRLFSRNGSGPCQSARHPRRGGCEVRDHRATGASIA